MTTLAGILARPPVPVIDGQMSLTDAPVGYIVVRHIEWEDTVQAESPSIVYTDRHEATIAASRLNSDRGIQGIVWEIDLSHLAERLAT